MRKGNIMKVVVLTGLLLFLCSGCGLPIVVAVDSISAGETVSEAKCIILPMDPNVGANDLQFREYADYVRRAIINKGYVATDDITEAQIALFLLYGISQPQERLYSYSTPVWGQTGVSSAHTSGTIHSYGSGMASYSGMTTYTPQYGVTGYRSHIGTQVTYTRLITLTAYDLHEYRRTQTEVQLWKTTAISTGSSGDFRRVFPVMLAASSDFIGENTGKQVEVTLFENDKRVASLKSAPPE